jgi:host factor-I protein
MRMTPERPPLPLVECAAPPSPAWAGGLAVHVAAQSSVVLFMSSSKSDEKPLLKRRPIIIAKGWHPVEAVNRKLIRPSLNEIKEQIAPPRRSPPQKKPAPPDQTNAENFYYVKQMQAKTAMVFVLRDGETLHGTIEWYDKCCLKVNRTGEPNILLYKPAIKYMYKEG